MTQSDQTTRRLCLKSGLGMAMLPITSSVFAGDPEIIRLTAPGAQLGEGCMWSARDKSIYWVDILGKKLHAYRLGDKRQLAWDMPELIGWVIERKKGGFIVGLKSGVFFLDLEPFKLTPAVALEPDKPDNRLNDAKADNKGRLWAGTMHMPFNQKAAALYRVMPDLSVKQIDAPYLCTNGPAFSPDFTRMYHNATDEGLTYVFDLSPDGELSNKRLFYKFTPDMGSPDGMTTDAEGGVWIACWGGNGVRRFTPDGKLDFHVYIPAKQTSCVTFGGEKLDRMFVTSAATGQPDDKLAGTLFEIPKALLRGHKGVPPQAFGG
jgi:xylono-1,5-lactonase